MPVDGVPEAGTKGRWTLTPGAFERLLAALDADRERAAAEYEALRRRVVGLLRWWGASNAEELGDETLDRLARKLEQGTTIAAGSLGPYVRGIARMVFYESTRDRVLHSTTREAAAAESDAADVEAASRCLDRCLDALAAADRALVLRYYDAGKSADVRRRLAEELGISATALRIRTHRLRASLERCVTACIGMTEEE